MEQEELAHWLANLPDNEIEYVEWLVEEVETALDKMLLEQSGLEAAQKILQKFMKSNEDKS
jgi:hypothetical protein